jgi:hypothetical protein
MWVMVSFFKGGGGFCGLDDQAIHPTDDATKPWVESVHHYE